MKTYLVNVKTTDGANHVYAVYAKTSRTVRNEAIKMHISNSYCDEEDIEEATLM